MATSFPPGTEPPRPVTLSQKPGSIHCRLWQLSIRRQEGFPGGESCAGEAEARAKASGAARKPSLFPEMAKWGVAFQRLPKESDWGWDWGFALANGQNLG